MLPSLRGAPADLAGRGRPSRSSTSAWRPSRSPCSSSGRTTTGRSELCCERHRAHAESPSPTAAPAPWTGSTSPSTEASRGCSARTGPARPRCCGSWPPRSPPTADGCACSGATRTGPTRERDRDPPRARLPAPGARLPQRHDRLRLRGVRRGPQGVERPPAPARGGTPGARPGRSRRPGHQAGRPALRRPAAPGRRSPRRCSASRGSSCSTSRPPGSTRPSAPTCVAPSRSSPASAPCCSPPTRPRTSPPCASASSCWPAARVRFDGAVTDLVATAAGPGLALPTSLAPTRVVSWRTGTGRHHVVGGTPPPGADARRAHARGRLPAHARHRRTSAPARAPA